MKYILFTLALSLGSVSVQAAAGNEALASQTSNLSGVSDFELALKGRITRGEGCTPEGSYIQWQCGGRPSGHGWVRVDRNCWHRDTGRRCY